MVLKISDVLYVCAIRCVILENARNDMYFSIYFIFLVQYTYIKYLRVILNLPCIKILINVIYQEKKPNEHDECGFFICDFINA